MCNNEINFDLQKRIGRLNIYNTGWAKEVNIISWNGGFPKLDIRDWDCEHEHMSRGITLHREEAEKLKDLLVEFFESETISK